MKFIIRRRGAVLAAFQQASPNGPDRLMALSARASTPEGRRANEQALQDLVAAAAEALDAPVETWL